MLINLETILHFNKLSYFHRNLHKSQNRMEKLKKALDEVDQQVAGMRKRLDDVMFTSYCFQSDI